MTPFGKQMTTSGIESPWFTLVMAVYNANAYLEESIHSVLQQTDQDFKLVIVNDGSINGSVKGICYEQIEVSGVGCSSFACNYTSDGCSVPLTGRLL